MFEESLFTHFSIAVYLVVGWYMIIRIKLDPEFLERRLNALVDMLGGEDSINGRLLRRSSWYTWQIAIPVGVVSPTVLFAAAFIMESFDVPIFLGISLAVIIFIAGAAFITAVFSGLRCFISTGPGGLFRSSTGTISP